MRVQEDKAAPQPDDHAGAGRNLQVYYGESGWLHLPNVDKYDTSDKQFFRVFRDNVEVAAIRLDKVDHYFWTTDVSPNERAKKEKEEREAKEAAKKKEKFLGLF